MASATAAPALDRGARLHEVRAVRASARRRIRAVLRPTRVGSRARSRTPTCARHRGQARTDEAERGLPDTQRPRTALRHRAAGDGVDPRRRPHRRQRCRADVPEQRPARAGLRAGHHQLPARPVRLLRAPRVVGRVRRRRVRQLRAAGPDRRPGMGARQHRGVRRRPRQRDDLRRVRRRRSRAEPDDLTTRSRPVPPSDRTEPERQRPLAPSRSTDARLRAGRRHRPGVRRAGRRSVDRSAPIGSTPRRCRRSTPTTRISGVRSTPWSTASSCRPRR